jgi:hypothetical protein
MSVQDGQKNGKSCRDGRCKAQCETTLLTAPPIVPVSKWRPASRSFSVEGLY